MVMAYYTLVICPSQLLVSKTHNNFNLRNEIIKRFAVLLVFIFMHEKKIVVILHEEKLHYTSPNLALHLLSDWLWVPLL